MIGKIERLNHSQISISRHDGRAKSLPGFPLVQLCSEMKKKKHFELFSAGGDRNYVPHSRRQRSIQIQNLLTHVLIVEQDPFDI